MIKFSLYLLTLLLVVSCTVRNDYTDFKNFSHRFKQIKLPITFNDQWVFRNWMKNDLIDTGSVERHGLVTSYVDNLLPLKNLHDYQCSYVGRYETKTYEVLLYKMKTADTIGGKPKIILATFSKDGKKKDEITGLWSDRNDSLYTNTLVLKIPDSSRVEVKSIIKQRETAEDQIENQKTILKIMRFEIQKDGKIVKVEEYSKDVSKLINPEAN
jgi:hypothetical protein